MSFNPACLPALPSCPEDMLAWSEDLIACLTENFTAAFDTIGTIACPTFDICDELALLGGPDCFVTPAGIDQTAFTYATAPEDVIAGNGVLPTPPDTGRINYRAGAELNINSQTCDDPGGRTITLDPPMVASSYAVFLTMGNEASDVFMFAPNESRAANSFQITVAPRDCDNGENRNVWVYWLAIEMT